MYTPLVSSEGSSSNSVSCPTEFTIQKPETLFMVEQIRRMRGGSQSHLMRCRGDDDFYIVKFQGNPQGTRILANELLGTLLAARLGLPTTPVAICYVSEELISLTNDLYVETAHRPPLDRIPCQPGLQFGSRFPLDPHRVTVFDFLPDKQLRTTRNFTAFLGMLVFDKWACNTDGRQTIFYLTGVDGRYETEMIDQGFCFNGSAWNFPDAPLLGLYARYAVYEQVHGIDDFEPWIAKLEQINEGELIGIAKSIPPEWYDSDSDSLQRLLEQLDRRRSKVRGLLWDTWKARPYAFPSWTEGMSQVALSLCGRNKEHNDARIHLRN